MHALSTLFLAVFALAGRVLALQIAIGGNVGNITANQFLVQNDAQLNSACNQTCIAGTQAINACGQDNECLCDDDTISPIVTCQECYFTSLIADNRKMPNLLAGSTPALSAYAKACKDDANIVVDPKSIALTLPANWDGPTGIGLGTGGTVVFFIAALSFGVGLISILCTM